MSPANDVNNPRPNIPRGYNQFPQSYMHLTTEPYGVYSPFYWAKCERGDIQNLHSTHNLHTFTMQSPFVGNLKKTKSYVKVPMYAIYPRTWEKQFTIPTQGSDVPSDARALFDVSRLVVTLLTYIKSVGTYTREVLMALCVLESICSHGSLFEKFNMHLDYKFITDADDSPHNIDYYLDRYIYPELFAFVSQYGIYGPDDTIYRITGYGPQDAPSGTYISPRRFLELLRRGELSPTDSLEEIQLTQIFDSLVISSGYNTANDVIGEETARFLNIEPIIAYQLACAQFATNDFVDFIYSAQLYRDNMQSLYSSGFTNAVFPTFIYNGVTYQYDVFSQFVFDRLMVINVGTASALVRSRLSFWLNLFSYVPALRYGDYFTGGKPTPLAVGEYTAAVNNNEVSAIDITRSIQMQRLLHRVNMVGRKIGDYLSGIFGGKLPEAPKDVPIFLAHQVFDVDGFEVNNTGSDQLNKDVRNITTTNLRSTKDKFAFEVTIDEPCYIIGMSSYAMMRIYSKTMDRFAFHHDRYDDFIPEMQYIGDQEIKAVELDCNNPTQLPFAYALRYMEYKQRYSYASGGFVSDLPTWAFVTDNADGNPPESYITPDYIRSSPSEFDRFYKSLTGFSLGTYYHFIVAYTNSTSPLRRMEYTPEILK